MTGGEWGRVARFAESLYIFIDFGWCCANYVPLNASYLINFHLVFDKKCRNVGKPAIKKL